MSEYSRDHDRSVKRIERGLVVILALPAVALVCWYLISSAHKSLPDGDFNCLNAESQARQELSERLGTPMIHDPRSGAGWLGRVENGGLVRVFDVHMDLETMEPAYTEADSFSMGEVLDDGQFAAIINGSSYTCTD